MRLTSSALCVLVLATPILVGQQSAPDGQDAKKDKPKVYEVGSKIDSKLSLVDLNGKQHTLGAYKGKTVVLAFWSSQCPYMKLGSPRIQAVHTDYAKQDVVVLGICSNKGELGLQPDWKDVNPEDKEALPYPALRKHLKKGGYTYPILADHGNVVADLFRARTTPHCYVIDAKGILRYQGAVDDDPRGKKGADARSYLREALDAVIAGQAVTTPNTKPYGCSIKRAARPKPRS